MIERRQAERRTRDRRAMPWMKWYGADWMGDRALRQCSYATKGFWADLISLMQLDDCGTITGTIEQFARMTGGTPDEVAACLAELRATGTADVTDSGALFSVTSRRLSRWCHAKLHERKAWNERQKRHRARNVTPKSEITQPLDTEAEADTESEETIAQLALSKADTAGFDFEALYREYPRKRGKSGGMRRCKREINTAARYEQLKRAVANYVAETRGRAPEHVLYWSSFMSEWQDWVAVEPESAPARRARAPDAYPSLPELKPLPMPIAEEEP